MPTAQLLEVEQPEGGSSRLDALILHALSIQQTPVSRAELKRAFAQGLVRLRGRAPKPSEIPPPGRYAIDLPLEEVEKNHILRSLTYHHGNKTKTAQTLGITIKTLYNKLHRYGVITAQVATPEHE
jgi:DNA-binding NtrC family response regulator